MNWLATKLVRVAEAADKSVLSAANYSVKLLSAIAAEEDDGDEQRELRISDELKEFVLELAAHPRTFTDFPLPPADQRTPPPPLTAWQERHVLKLLDCVPEFDLLRYRLCPGLMAEHDFWQIYFILCRGRLASPAVPRRAPLADSPDRRPAQQQQADTPAQPQQQQHAHSPAAAAIVSSLLAAQQPESPLELYYDRLLSPAISASLRVDAGAADGAEAADSSSIRRQLAYDDGIAPECDSYYAAAAAVHAVVAVEPAAS
eukprot:TRINITY_DN1382_c0_g1_i2.p1 TRINITY_DN1382_c0_g1~~TRINITY_DN1382_c0_g1_i2.p1  ORF type:complete len:259 (+),score=119.76 TRINITY_DN1382_c0_g1_i2:163-939(+)